jgi:hypothetical protein
VVATTIQYSAITGSITASITADNGTSSITITRPFPNEPGLFASWKEFFERAASRAGTNYVLSQPVLNLEPGGGADKQTLCTLLPFDIRGVTLPGVPTGSASYAFGLESGVPCTTQPAVLNF